MEFVGMTTTPISAYVVMGIYGLFASLSLGVLIYSTLVPRGRARWGGFPVIAFFLFTFLMSVGFGHSVYVESKSVEVYSISGVVETVDQVNNDKGFVFTLNSYEIPLTTNDEKILGLKDKNTTFQCESRYKKNTYTCNYQ